MKKIILILLITSCGKTMLSEKKNDLKFAPPQEQVSHQEDERAETEIEPKPQVNFQMLREAFLDSKCLKCHAWVSVKETFNSRIVFGKPHQSSVYLKIDSGSMPPFGPRITQEHVDLLERYILEAMHLP